MIAKSISSWRRKSEKAKIISKAEKLKNSGGISGCEENGGVSKAIGNEKA
jgi:hypothetical protein